MMSQALKGEMAPPGVPRRAGTHLLQATLVRPVLAGVDQPLESGTVDGARVVGQTADVCAVGGRVMTAPGGPTQGPGAGRRHRRFGRR